MIFFHPIVHIAASGVVRCQSQHVVALELLFQRSDVPCAVLDILLRFMQFARIVLLIVDLLGNPQRRFRHQLHQADGAAMRFCSALKLALRQDHARYERTVHLVLCGVMLDNRAIWVGVDVLTLHGFRLHGEKKGKRHAQDDDAKEEGGKTTIRLLPSLPDASVKIVVLRHASSLFPPCGAYQSADSLSHAAAACAAVSCSVPSFSMMQSARCLFSSRGNCERILAAASSSV